MRHKKKRKCLNIDIELIFVYNDLFRVTVYLFTFKCCIRTSEFFYCNFVEMYAKEVIARLLLAQKTAKEISEVAGCHLAAVYRVKKLLQDASKPRTPGSGRPRIARTPNVIKSVRAKIARNPVRSIRKLAVEANISERSMRRVIKDDLHASSRARVKRHLITERVKELRVSRSKRLLSLLKKGK